MLKGLFPPFGESNSQTRSPVDLALALFRTVFLSSDSWLLPLRVFC